MDPSETMRSIQRGIKLPVLVKRISILRGETPNKKKTSWKKLCSKRQKLIKQNARKWCFGGLSHNVWMFKSQNWNYADAEYLEKELPMGIFLAIFVVF